MQAQLSPFNLLFGGKSGQYRATYHLTDGTDQKGW
jgi:hypothetical protein